MLSAIVAQIVRRTSKWRPPSWDPEDFEQEVWEAVLAVEQEGETDPGELLRRAEDRVQSRATRESQRLEVPVGWITEEIGGTTTDEEPPDDFLSGPRYSGLTDREKEVIQLVFIEELDQRTAGQRLVPPTNQQGVSRLLRQAKAKIKTAIENEED